MTGLIAGFWLSLSLIVAIGAQNAFILKQGLRKEYVFILCLICAVSDALLICLGVFGYAWVAERLPAVEPFARYGGAAFLFYYGLRSFIAAFQKTESLQLSDAPSMTLKAAVLSCLAFTWLNPHVYLDTVVFLGSISGQYPTQKTEFAIGAALASLVFFFGLGYGSRLLTPIFQNPRAWKILDFIIGCVMWAIALSLFR